MMDRETTACLHVVGDRHDGYGLWAPVVSDVAALTELPAVLEGHLHNDDGTGLHQGVVSFAAATSDPVLVLPLNEPPGPAEGTSTPRRRRVLVPTERSRTGRRQIREWIGRAERLGFEVVQIHVLTEATAPSMWEGPGHHAEAWWAEVRRRHQIGTASLSIRSGEPAEPTPSGDSSAAPINPCCSSPYRHRSAPTTRVPGWEGPVPGVRWIGLGTPEP